MQKLLVILSLFTLIGCSTYRFSIILSEGYNFLLPNDEVSKLRQCGDTLYENSFYIDRAAESIYKTHYKIISVSKSGDFCILKLESLDTNQFEFCAGRIFSMMVLKNLSKNQLEYYYPFHCLTRSQLDTIQINNLSLNARSRVTYFSDTYLKKLSNRKKVSTLSTVKEIVDAVEGNNFDSGRISYSAEQLNKACIEKGYNPVGAGLAIDSLMRLK